MATKKKRAKKKTGKKRAKKRTTKKRATKKATTAKKAAKKGRKKRATSAKRASRKQLAGEVKQVLDEAAAMAKREREKGFKEGFNAGKKACPPKRKAAKKAAKKTRPKSAKAPSRKRSAGGERKVTAAQILGGAKKAGKSSFWVCANPAGRRTGCGGSGSRVVTAKGSFTRIRPVRL